MSEHKVEYRGFEVPANYLAGGSLFGANMTALSGWKRGVDDVVDSLVPPEPEDKTEYFRVGPSNPGSFYAIRPSGVVEYFAGSMETSWVSQPFEGPEWVRRQGFESASADEVPANFRLEGSK